MYRTHPSRRRSDRLVIGALIASLALAAGCGDDDDDETVAPSPAASVTAATPATTETPITDGETGDGAPSTEAGAAIAPDDEEFCAAAEVINAIEGFPTVEQVEEYAVTAPDELAEPIGVVLDLLREADGNFPAVFADPTGGEALEEITAVEAERCGTDGGGGEDAGAPQDPSVTQIDPAATRIEVEAIDYEFVGDLPSEPGRYSFVMTNAGAEPHIMILVGLDDGVTVDEVLDSDGEVGVVEEFESEVATPDGEAVLTVDLRPGNWVLLCPIPNADGAPHFVHGMIEEFTVA